MQGKFMIRVYALIIHSDFILVCDENYDGVLMTKFPGGGVEFGEGIKEALYREIYEEMQAEILEATHFYTTDFFQQSAFHPNTQLISVYYLVTLKNPFSFQAEVSLLPNYPENKHQSHFRWVPLKQLSSEGVTFPIDKHVVYLLRNQLNK
ncbi:MAG: NUDIX domain-containing protein [Flavobacteriales bacterium]|nr:NUDIX domain-containing protein [Flavobacteriales bacterium]